MAANVGVTPLVGWSDNADFPGIKLPDFDAAAWQRQLPDDLSPEAVLWAIQEHKYWSRLDVVGNRRAWTQELIDDGNAVREFLHHVQSLIVYYSRCFKGMQTDTSRSIGSVPPVTNMQWKVETVSVDDRGFFVECAYRTGDPDPRAIQTYQLVSNPDFVPGGEEPKYLNDTTTFALVNFGLCVLTAPSTMLEHGGRVAWSFDVSPTLEHGDTFKVYTIGAMPSNWASVWPPDSTDDVLLKYYFHPAHCKEYLVGTRLEYPLHVVRPADPFEVTSPTNSKYTISSTKIVVPYSADNPYLRCVKVDGGGVEYAEIAGAGLIEVSNAGDGDHVSKLDLTGVDLSDTPAAVRLYYFIESDSEYAAPSIPNRCSHHVADPSNSWGEQDGDGACHTCRLRTVASTYLDGDFDPNGCFSTECNQFTLAGAGPTPATNPDMLKQLVYGLPWRETQFMAGFTYTYLERFGAPSLTSLFNCLWQVAAGFHPVINFGIETMAFRKREVIGRYMQLQFGLWIESAFGKGGSNLLNALSWQPQGPGTGTWTREKQYPGDEDRQLVHSTQVLACDASANPYRMEFNGSLGRAQRFRAGFVNLLHNLRSTDGVSTYRDGTFERGTFEIDGVEYSAKAVLKAVRFDRATAADWGNASGPTARIHSAYRIDEKHIAIYLESGTVSASTQGSIPQYEYSSTWRQGGTNVDLREDMQVKNWANTVGRLGGPSQTSFRAGMVAGIVDQTGLHRMWIKDAQACYGGGGAYPSPARTQPWEPSANQRPFNLALGGWLVIAIAPGRQLQAGLPIEVKRDLTTPGDLGVTLDGDDGLDGIKPAELQKDEYYWHEEIVSSNERRLWLLFSPLNDTTDTLDRALTIYYKTENIGGGTEATNTYEHDLWSGAGQGWSLLKSVITGAGAATGVESVRVLRLDGSELVLTDSELGSIPNHYAVWPQDDYRATNEGGGVWNVYVSPRFAGETLIVELRYAPSGLSQSLWYDQTVAPHGTYQLVSEVSAVGSLPAQHKSWASRMDRIVIFDPTGHWWRKAASSINWFTSKQIAAGTNGIFIDETTEVDARMGSDVSDVRCFGADGVVYLRNPKFADDLAFTAQYAVRDGSALAAELNALPTILQRGLENGVSTPLSGVNDPGRFPLDYIIVGRRNSLCNADGGALETEYVYEAGPAGVNPVPIASGGFLFPEITAGKVTLQMTLSPFRIPQLDRTHVGLANIENCYANLTISGASAFITHIKCSVIEGDISDTTGRPNPNADGHDFLWFEWTGYQGKGKYVEMEIWQEFPATVTLKPLLLGYVKNGDDIELRVLGGGGIGGQTVQTNNPAAQTVAIECKALAEAYVENRECMAFALINIPSGVPFRSLSDSAESSAQALFEALTSIENERCEFVGVSDIDGHSIYQYCGEFTGKSFVWSSFVLSDVFTQFKGDITIPAEARVMTDYMVRQDPVE